MRSKPFAPSGALATDERTACRFRYQQRAALARATESPGAIGYSSLLSGTGVPGTNCAPFRWLITGTADLSLAKSIANSPVRHRLRVTTERRMAQPPDRILV
jgi:hypothetical protein